MLDMGYDYAAVDDYLEEHGLCELRHELVVETLGKPNFRNPLFIPQGDERPSDANRSKVHQQSQQLNYGYYQPGIQRKNTSQAPAGNRPV
jgi:hypothetical protein